MRAKKMILIPVFFFLSLMFSSCAGLYIGGGGALLTGGGEAATYESWSGEDIIFPKLGGGLGYFAEIGSFEKEGTMQAAFLMLPVKGSFKGADYDCLMYQLSCGARIGIQEEDFPVMITLPFNLTYQMLTVQGSSNYGGEPGDVVFSGFGANAGIGAMAVIADALLFNIEALWTFESYGNARAVKATGKIDEAPFVTGPALKAGLYLML